MASVRGKSKSTCRRMRINLIDETFEEVMQWNTAQSNDSSSMCETEVEHHRQNQTSGASVNDASSNRSSYFFRLLIIVSNVSF